MRLRTAIYLLLSCLPTPVLAAQTLTFATTANYPPFVYIAANGHIAGFDVDIVNALCKQMQAQCQIENLPWHNLFSGLVTGQYDAVFGGIAINAERNQVMSFTIPYYQSTESFVVNQQHPFPLTLQGIHGKVIGVEMDTSFEAYLKGVYGGYAIIQPYNSVTDAFAALKVGAIDAVLTDTPVAEQWLQQPGNETFALNGEFTDVRYFGPGNGIALRKNQTELLQDLNTAITAIKANGTYQKIYQRYFNH
jgi:lysine-arginine-ornithine-binding protein